MISLKRVEITSYILLLLGVGLDQVSTRIGLSQYNLIESNFIANRLITLGLWGYVDLALCTAFIIITHLSYRIVLEERNNLIFAFPFISGAIRLLVGLMNVTLL